MGSRQVREAHLMRYGCSMTEMKTGEAAPSMTLDKQRASCNRLAATRRPEKVFAHKPRSNRDVIQTDDNDELFPRHLQVEEVADIAKDVEYPVNWRRLPSETEGGRTTWVYEKFPLNIETPYDVSLSEIQRLLSKSLAEKGASVVDATTHREDVRRMVRDVERFGVLVDLIATKRNILSGVPHQLANQVYQFLEERYPVSVKFAFVGITDNATKLVAKSLFDRNSSTKKVSFDDVDYEHLFIAHPKGDQEEQMRQRGAAERSRKEEELRLRRWTPRYTPPPPPEWMQRATEAVERTRSQVLPLTGYAKPDASSSCSRCWKNSNDTAYSNKSTSVLPHRDHHNGNMSGPTTTTISTTTTINNDKSASRKAPRSPSPLSLAAESPQSQDEGGSPSPSNVVSPKRKANTFSSADVYTMENCVARLKAVRKQRLANRDERKAVSRAVELTKVVERVSLKVTM